jgi:hypothetical protein
MTNFSDTVLMQSANRNLFFRSPRLATCLETEEQEIRAILVDAP